MLGYALPVPEGKLSLWLDAPRSAWGELDVGEITVLSPDPNLKVGNMPLLIHDNVYRPTVRKLLSPPARLYLSRLTLWGLIWLLGIDQPLQDVVGGLYLFLGIPLFMGMLGAANYARRRKLTDRLMALFRYPAITIEYSPRLAKLRDLMDSEGPYAVLDNLNQLGLGHLREFYRRASWNQRWQTMSPTGAGHVSQD